MKEKKAADEQESCAEVPDENKREFVTKLVAAAGIAALAGLAGEASASMTPQEKMQIVKQKTGKFANGFRMEFFGKPIGDAMVAAGIASPNANLNNARLTIEFIVP